MEVPHTPELLRAADEFLRLGQSEKYSYGFSWMGRPIIQYPQDVLALQEVIWSTRPDVIIETGVAHGGSAVFYASLLELNQMQGGNPEARVVAIELDLRPQNRAALAAHPMSRRIRLIDGSSTSPEVIRQVTSEIRGAERIMVVLDSDHSAAHVLAELRAYAPLVSQGCYCVVLDTVIEYVDVSYPDREWCRGNSPATAVAEYLAEDARWLVDHDVDERLLVSVARGGYLRRIA